ncbi:hypothetical protein P152DRAFT_471592 [Eremomyces bilateralis CBS 781.70]|uniref:SGNH hydrolase-type esterase domain-containing protein n=1 Tax=Eremomyces bilateralis CBS 781.70 TaxID=1392243 RepID=A0A6G1GA28_9PEZI|nr:uncharacterized protein P152DRAFT_471592 [Eremomyces bilateralis CBS 781.70]KAF1814937.1 hypothetical protein P152DRAFT_471592 [Eremomyces bilateralis CBS 781.70]
MAKLKLAEEREINILAFGNSLTEGYTDWGMTLHPYAIELRKTLSAEYPNRNVTVDVNGQSGDFVISSFGGNFFTRLQSSYEKLAEKGKSYDLVIALGGTNDLAMASYDEKGPEKIFAALKLCYDYILQGGSSLLVLTVPERSLDTEKDGKFKHMISSRLRLNELLKEYVTSQASASPSKVFMMDLAAMVPFPVVAKDDDNFTWDYQLWSPDGLHMSTLGYNFVGGELGSLIQQLLSEEKPEEE